MRKNIAVLLITALLAAFGLGGAAAQDQNIVDTASGNPDFSTLVTAVQAAGLVDVLADQLSDMTAPSMEMSAVGAETTGCTLDIQAGDDGANVVTADIIASNGVIHVVDSVLLPPDVAAMLAGNEANRLTAKFRPSL
jgi:transforming growth factor-beta-induced protein